MKKRFIIICSLFVLSSCEEETLKSGYSDEESTVHDVEITVIELAYPDVEGEFITIPQPKGGEVVLRKIGNDYIWMGDIILNKNQIKNFYENGITERTALSTLSKHWPKATIYYKISSDLPNQQRVTNAIDRWKQSAPYLNFVVRTNQTNYIEFIPGSGCSSNLGMIGGRQLIKLASTCTTGNAMHEIGHAIGLLHEQTRTDRDNFIRVLINNIRPNRRSQFNRYDQEGISGFQIGTIDYNSIMMYPSFNSFAINSNLPTMERLDGSTWPANRTNLSVGDIEITDLLYGGLYAKLYFVTTEYENGPEDDFHTQDVYVKFYSDVNYSNPVSLNQNVDFKFKIVNTNEYSGTSSINFYSKSLTSGNQSYFIQNYTRTDIQYDYGDIEPGSYSQALTITQGFSYID